MRKCAQARNFAQGERLPKRDIVDTSFHASCAEGQGTATRTNLPTTWEKGTEQKQGAYRVRYQLGLHCAGLLWMGIPKALSGYWSKTCMSPRFSRF